jgi:16S rRNA G966 N2-methylase RsmD
LGGIAGMTPAGWRMVNGYPNDFFGWGGEDDELRNRINHTKTVVNDTYYDRSKFKLRDLENLKMKDKLKRVQSNEDTYNVIKNEIVELHRKKGGIGLNGLNDIETSTRIISWNPHADYSWIDTVLVAVLPSAYPVLPKSTYASIPEDKLYGVQSNASYRALSRYGALVEIGYNWGIGDTTEEMSVYDSIRATETIYGPNKQSDHRSVRGWRSRLSGLRDSTGATERILSDGSKVSLHTQLWLDPTGAFSISYPETADAMASILASMTPTGSSIIDMTACVGGNSAYFSYYFKTVTSIEIAPHRQQILEHNLRLLHPGNEEQIITVDYDTLIKTPSSSRSKVNIVSGDSLEFLTTSPVSYKDLARSDPLGQVLFLDPPWGGPNYMYLPRPLTLEMVTRTSGGITAAEFLKPILDRILLEKQMLPPGKGLLSEVKHIGMKVPNEYDIDGLRKILKRYGGVATDPFVIPDRTRKNRVYFIVMTLLL